MNSQRKLKIESEIVKTISKLIVSGKVKDHRIGLVSVHRADLSEDMSHVKVWVTSYIPENEIANFMKGLKSASGYIQSIVGKELGLRITPKISFVWDEAYIKGFQVNQLIDELSQKTE
ncbi:MAG: 30S ribosome-binding factor RbfA [Leptospiraceae bacterium]|nr:30S ribosome-binding factor RbfA [Leptospiraceae bacterium]MCK6379758.1 30S ribosome-binding factor RbfA [Leptospiraceae bacterium]